MLDNITKYEYNKLGNITKLILGLTSVNEEINPEIHQVTNYTYNNLNQLISVTSPEGITTHFTYDYLGQNLSKYNDNVNTSYIYDGLGRVKEINAIGNSKDENISYTYDLMGNIKSMTDSSGVTDYTYDSLGQLIREVRGADVKEYTYDANGNRKTFKLNNEINQTYTYDILNRLISVSDGTDTVSYSYDNNGNLLSETGAVDVDYTYNHAGQIISKINSTVNGNIDNFSVSYYLNGNISDITENDKTTSYIYDNLGRLTKENVSTEGETLYTYDNFSNRTAKISKDLSGNIISQSDYLYNKNNQLLSEISGNKTTNYSYDINGNLIFKTYTELSDVENGENTFTMGNILPNYIEEYIYDALNRLSAFNTSQINASYTYDGNGLRQTKTVNGITENHIYDGQNIVKSGNQTFIRGIGLISRNDNGSKEYYSFNVHGDTTKLTDTFGTILKDYSYDAFGNQKAENENDTNPFRYSGEFFDEETGLIYLRARYYDATTGRFISEDPIKDGLNWYVYCSNNPIMFVDPLGLEDVLLGDIMKKNGATVVVNKKGWWIFSYGLKSITVTLNGITKEYTDSDYRIINGKSVIDNSILMNDFGLDEMQSTHQPDSYEFSREEDAALAFGLKYGQRSKDERQEYGATINKDSNGNYCFADVSNSNISATLQGKSIDEGSKDTDPLRNQVAIKLSENSVAMIHTHWRSNGNINFSNPQDYPKNTSLTSLYLVNRDGVLYQSRKTNAQGNINGWYKGKRLFSMR